jgi:hypothetical protein
LTTPRPPRGGKLEFDLAKGFESGDRQGEVLAVVTAHFARVSELQNELIHRRVALF